MNIDEYSIKYYFYENELTIMSHTTCKNCGTELKSYFKHCPECGQKVDEDLTLGLLFNNTISNYFSVDARFFRSFVPLLFKPGFLAKQFVSGKRLTYLHPAQMYLFVSVVFFFLFSFVERDTTQSFDKALQKNLNDFKAVSKTIQDAKPLDSSEVENIVKPFKENQKALGISDEKMRQIDSLSQIPQGKADLDTDFTFNQKTIDSLIAAGARDEVIYNEMGMAPDAGWFSKKFYSQMLKFYKTRSGGSILQAFYDSIPIALFVLLPIFALILKLFYLKRGRYAHHLVFGFYFFSFLFALFGVDLLVNLFVYDIPNSLDWLIALSSFFYLWLAIRNFYRQGWFVSFFKSGMVSFVFLLLVLPFALVVMALTAFLMY